MKKQLGQFCLFRKVGAGMTGEVYLATHVLSGKVFAIKVLPKEATADSAFHERLLEKGSLMTSLRHPAMVGLYNLDFQDGVFYIVMDPVAPDERAPMTLKHYLKARGGRLPEEEATRILEQICEAMMNAHENAIFHGNLKPANILLDKGNVVRVSDFGLVELLGSAQFLPYCAAHDNREAMPDAAMGSAPPPVDSAYEARRAAFRKAAKRSLYYMPPEMRKDGVLSTQGDVYSIGVLAYQMLTGILPRGQWKPPSQLTQGISEGWDAIMQQALNEKAHRRYLLVDRLIEEMRQTCAPPRTTLPASPAATRPDNAAVPTPGTVGPTADSSPSDGPVKKQRARNGMAAYEIMNFYYYWNELGPPESGRQEEESVRDTALKAGDVQEFLGMKFVWIPPGAFMMGSPQSEQDYYDHQPTGILYWVGESPFPIKLGKYKDETLHHATLTQGFWLGKCTINQEEWQRVMGANPSCRKRNTLRPVESVSWKDCQQFLQKLNEQGEGVFRLPTETEWEYACRAGASGAFANGNEESDLWDGAWYAKNGGYQTQQVGMKTPNAWGLHDMNGNVWEWCQDWYGDYPLGPVTDPAGPKSGKFKVLRGGAFLDGKARNRCATRNKMKVGMKNLITGVRIARMP